MEGTVKRLKSIVVGGWLDAHALVVSFPSVVLSFSFVVASVSSLGGAV